MPHSTSRVAMNHELYDTRFDEFHLLAQMYDDTWTTITHAIVPMPYGSANDYTVDAVHCAPTTSTTTSTTSTTTTSTTSAPEHIQRHVMNALLRTKTFDILRERKLIRLAACVFVPAERDTGIDYCLVKCIVRCSSRLHMKAMRCMCHEVGYVYATAPVTADVAFDDYNIASPENVVTVGFHT